MRTTGLRWVLLRAPADIGRAFSLLNSPGLAHDTAVLSLLVSILLGIHSHPAPAVRVSVLSLLAPQRVELRCRDSRVELTSGKTLLPGQVLRIERIGRGIRAVDRDGHRTRIERLAVNPLGGQLEVHVFGRESRWRRYSAPLEIWSEGGRLVIVATVPLEEFVASGLAAEFNQIEEPEALRAGAVAIRSLVAAVRSRHQASGFDFCDTTHCLVSRGESDLDTKAGRTACAATVVSDGLVLVHTGQIVAGYCTACCGGTTLTPADVWDGPDAGDYSRVECHWCTSSPKYRWVRTAPAAAVQRVVVNLVRKKLSGSFDIRTFGNDRAATVEIDDGRTAQTIDGEEFRMALGRRLGWNVVLSPRFTLERVRDRYRFRGRGFGHCIGLCIAGAVTQAREGRTWTQILECYFPHARCARLLRPSPPCRL